jgi:transcriptional regulator with XRE-family HTH domain
VDDEEDVSIRPLRPEARLGAALRTTRVERGISLRALARKLHRSHSCLVEYERGHRLAPLDIVQAYEKELRVTGGTLATLYYRAHLKLYGEGWDRSRQQTRVARSATHPTLHQFPADVTVFTGRKIELAQLRGVVAESMADGVPVVVVAIVDVAGMGKTALAVRLAHELVPQFLDGQLYGTEEPVVEAGWAGTDVASAEEGPPPGRSLDLTGLTDIRSPGVVPRQGCPAHGGHEAAEAATPVVLQELQG